MDDDLDLPDLQVSQCVNPIPHIQNHLTALSNARRASDAALPLAHLYVLLRGLRRLDRRFQREWSKILRGEFLHYAGDSFLRARLSWPTIWNAKGALLDLMDRRGMVFKVQGQDPVDVEESKELADLDAWTVPGPEPAGDDDE